MKQCPKCSNKHTKSGIFCSRSCANSRIFSDESKEKKSIAATGKTHNSQDDWSQESKDSWISKLRDTYKEKDKLLSFDEISFDKKRIRVFEEQNYCCGNIDCGISEWFGKKISLELEHKDGNNQNNLRENLIGLCPNCHSNTDTWRGRNKGNMKMRNKVSDADLISAYAECKTIRQALIKVGLSPKGGNYVRAKRIIGVVDY